jgi:LAO/AO transport system kinase
MADQEILEAVQAGNYRLLARAISYIENGIKDYSDLLSGQPNSSARIIGITGPPGAGKSTLTDQLIGQFVVQGKRVAVLCVDPSSTFHFGALLGDRIRMSDWYNHPRVFIRSLATRGALGGLNAHIFEISELLRAVGFDYILIETVGVGQNEIEIARLADTTVVVLAPESGDDIQGMKAGLLEVADIFVVNKSDRPDAEIFVRNLRSMLSLSAYRQHSEVPILQTIASQKMGVSELAAAIGVHAGHDDRDRRSKLLAEQAWLLIQYQKMKHIDKDELAREIEELMRKGAFNLYSFVARRV